MTPSAFQASLAQSLVSFHVISIWGLEIIKNPKIFETWGSYLLESIIPKSEKVKLSVLFSSYEKFQAYTKIKYDEPSYIHHPDTVI